MLRWSFFLPTVLVGCLELPKEYLLLIDSGEEEVTLSPTDSTEDTEATDTATAPKVADRVRSLSCTGI